MAPQGPRRPRSVLRYTTRFVPETPGFVPCREDQFALIRGLEIRGVRAVTAEPARLLAIAGFQSSFWVAVAVMFCMSSTS